MIIACRNLWHIGDWLADIPRVKTRMAPFVLLAQAAAG
jgi:hypothetical protein